MLTNMRKLLLSSTLLVLAALNTTTFAQTYYVSGSATETGSDIAMTELLPNGSSIGVYESFQRLQVGTYTIKASSADGAEVVYGSDGAGHLVEDGEPVYYSISGLHLPAAQRGVTITKSGNSVVKQLVR